MPVLVWLVVCPRRAWQKVVMPVLSVIRVKLPTGDGVAQLVSSSTAIKRPADAGDREA
jgi:hypothetical protein